MIHKCDILLQLFSLAMWWMMRQLQTISLWELEEELGLNNDIAPCIFSNQYDCSKVCSL